MRVYSESEFIADYAYDSGGNRIRIAHGLPPIPLKDADEVRRLVFKFNLVGIVETHVCPGCKETIRASYGNYDESTKELNVELRCGSLSKEVSERINRPHDQQSYLQLKLRLDNKDEYGIPATSIVIDWKCIVKQDLTLRGLKDEISKLERMKKEKLEEEELVNGFWTALDES
jgi:hypothetical protein